MLLGLICSLTTSSTALEVIVAGRSVKSIVRSPNTGLDITDTRDLWKMPQVEPREPCLERWERKLQMSAHNNKVRQSYSEPENLRAKALAESVAEARLKAQVENAMAEKDFEKYILHKTLEIADLSAELTRNRLDGNNAIETRRLEAALESVRAKRAELEAERNNFRTNYAYKDSQLAQLQAKIVPLIDDLDSQDALQALVLQVDLVGV